MNNSSTPFDLLLELNAQSCSDKIAELIVQAKQTNVNWTTFFLVCMKNGMASAIYQKLQLVKNQLSKEMIHPFKTAYQKQCIHNNRIYTNLAEILESFSKSEIDVIVLKGAALVEFVYDDKNSRPIGDIDLLIKPVDTERAVKTLEQLGFKFQMDFRSNFHKNTVFENQDKKHIPCLSRNYVDVELHLSLVAKAKGYEQLMQDAWTRAETVPFEGTTMKVLSSTHHLLYLCIHAESHVDNLMELKWYRDIERVLNRLQSKFDWTQFVEQAIAYELLPIVVKHFYVSKKYMNAIVPSIITEMPEYDSSNPKMFAPYSAFKSSRKSEFRKLKTFRTRALFVFWEMFPNRKWMISRYQPSSTAALYLRYPFRIFTGAMRAIRSSSRSKTRQNVVNGDAL